MRSFFCVLVNNNLLINIYQYLHRISDLSVTDKNILLYVILFVKKITKKIKKYF